MLNDINETIRALLFLYWPKNDNGEPVVYDKVIKIWKIGENAQNANVPSITIDTESTGFEKISSQTIMIEHKIKFIFDSQNSTTHFTNVEVKYIGNVIYQIIKQRQKIWVLSKCPFCLKRSFTPEHYIIDHQDEIQPYIDIVNQEILDNWNIWNSSSVVPTIHDAAIAACAVEKVMDAISRNIATPSLSEDTIRNFNFLINDRVNPVRLLSNLSLQDLSQSQSTGNPALTQKGEFSITYKEIDVISTIDPNSISITAW